ncbi:MAG: MATE family efflux transporter [bacterium]|nr:MATE family efflux transporter [bacterium]
MKSRISLSEHFTYGKLLLFTLPSIIMNVFTSMYSIVDGYFVANFAGKTEFAAVNLIMPVMTILGTFGYMFGAGGSALIAKTLGEKNNERANRLFSLFVLLSFVFGVLTMVLGFMFMEPITSTLGAEGELLKNSVLYGRIIILAIPASILLFEFQLFFVVAEKPKLGLAVTVCAGLCNIFLDALFIIGFHWGLAGAAAASALSQIVGGAFPIIYFLRKNDSLLQLAKPVWDFKALIKCCTNGSSEFMAGIAVSFVSIIYNVQLLKYAGEDGVAIYGVMMYVCMLFSAMFVGYSNGIGPAFSYNLGAQNHEELKNLRKRSLTIIWVISAAMFIISETLAYPLSAIFLHKTPKLLPDTVHAFRIFSIAYLFMGTSIFCSAFFTALNNGLVSALISFLRTLVFELGSVLLLPLVLGVTGIWCSVVIAELMSVTVGSTFIIALRKKYHY